MADPIFDIIFGSSSAEEDVKRWISEGFVFSSSIPWGLRQTYGGPCAVLAPVQAFIIADLLTKSLMPDPTVDECQSSLVEAISFMLWRARPDFNAPACFRNTSYASLDSLKADLASYNLSTSGAVVEFVRGLISTRTVEGIKKDLSFDSDPFVSRFGHGTQELVNLCLFGRAFSHLFDGNRFLAPNMEICGVPCRGRVGFLSQLEVLQYQKVGNWCRFPELPIWIIASSTHYTVLFALDLDVGKISDCQVQEHRAEAEFSKYDQSESGFISIQDLPALLCNLGRDDLTTPDRFNQLKAAVDSEGCGVVLWPLLWESLRPGAQADGPWACIACTYLNITNQSECEMCSTPAPARPPTVQENESPGPDQFLLYHYNGIENHIGAQAQCTEVAVTVMDTEGIPQGQTTNSGLREVIQTRWHGAIVEFPSDLVPKIT
uniref:ubiquitinyl hydrolase 1 n=1 Tax=Spongospora subterranea TaxID=70186 RepID=A0A0H5R8W2_9EUKA|eukprot:CRZ10226.1 hypothetical protein [Spongospora subterranea]